MATYRIFEFPAAPPEDVEEGKNIKIVRDGFSLPALVFTFFWLIWHRLWLAFVIFIIALSVGTLLVRQIDPILALFFSNFMNIFIAIEGTNWQAYKLERKGWVEVDVVLAGNYEEAEARAFENRGRTPITHFADAANKFPISEPVSSGKIWSQQRKTPKMRAVIGSFPGPYTGRRT